jgi:hypothetical protein
MCHAQTIVGGLISGNVTWSLAGSPYIVTNNTLISSGSKLTIDPGVVLKFDSGKALQVRGTLVAKGTSSAGIVFTSNAASPAAGDWKYILFEDESIDYDSISGTGSILEYCTIEYAGVPAQQTFNNEGVIKLLSAHPKINSCIIHDMLATGIYATAVDHVKVTNCEIYNGLEGGIMVHVFNHLTISHCIIRNNGNPMNSYALNFKPIQAKWGPDYTIEWNTVCNNYGGGIELAGGTAGSIFKNNLILGNVSPLGTFPLEWEMNGHEVISNNIFARNRSTMEYPVVFLNALTRQIGNFSINHFVDNEGLIRIQADGGDVKQNTIVRNTSRDSFQVWLEDYPAFHYNNMLDNNSIGGNPIAYLRNYNYAADPDINLESNWWGSNNPGLVQANMYDWFDDVTLGVIDFIPYLIDLDTIAPVSPPRNVTKHDLGGGTVYMEWAPNPEMDIAGYKIHWGMDPCYSFTNTLDVGNVTSFVLTGINNFNDSIALTAYDNLKNNINDQFDGNESWYTMSVVSPESGISESDINVRSVVYPCPLTTSAEIRFNNPKKETYTFLLYDAQGRVVREGSTVSGIYLFEKGDLSEGIYLYRLCSASGKSGSGKLLIQ